jgi:hypothetical protein
MSVFFVHGIAQENRSSKSIHSEWMAALNDGLKDAGESPVAVPCNAAYYGDLLIQLTDTANAAPDFPKNPDEMVRSDADYQKFVAEYLLEAASRLPNAVDSDADDLRRAAGVFAQTRTPQIGGDHPDFLNRSAVSEDELTRAWYNLKIIVDAVRAIDSHLPAISSLTISLILKTVYSYISNDEVRKRINHVVRQDLIKHRPKTIVAHSLGSVVAYNVLAEGGFEGIRFVTVGSPLGIGAIRRRIQKNNNPSTIIGWHNAFDSKDIVALNPLFKEDLSVNITIGNDGEISNESENHHHISGYLNKGRVAAVIAKTLRMETHNESAVHRL